MKQVLVIGGYGGFGARLSQRLADDGWRVLVAGRDAGKARAFAARLPVACGLAFDRNGDCAAQLALVRPDLVIDAAGPFQGSDYRLPQACIAAGVNYLDLADGREFVCGFSVLNQAAQAAGVVAISGASSVPALSGAVLRQLTAGMERIAAVDTAISATTRGSAGPSVVAAALSYAGQEVPLWRGEAWTKAYGWGEMRRQHFTLPGETPLRRLVALADVPDLAIFPQQLPGQPAVTFRGGSETALQMVALALLGGPVRLGWMKSAAPLARWLAPIQQLTARFSGTRSAMAVEALGWAGGKPLRRRWTLIARDGEGQEIPTLAAQALARRLREGLLKPGARDASGELELADFEPLLAALPLRHGRTEQPAPALYQRVLGERFDALAEPVARLHASLAEQTLEGEARVERGGNPLALLLGRFMGFPPAGNYPLRVRFVQHGRGERWTRSFGPHSFSSAMSSSRQGRLIERFGPLRFHFALEVSDDGALTMNLQRWTALGLPMPLALGPRIVAGERAVGDSFGFDVGVAMPLIGKVVRYVGTLEL